MQLIAFERPICHSTALDGQSPMGMLGCISELVRPGAPPLWRSYFSKWGVQSYFHSQNKKVPKIRGIWKQVWKFYQAGENSKSWNMVNVSP